MDPEKAMVKKKTIKGSRTHIMSDYSLNEVQMIWGNILAVLSKLGDQPANFFISDATQFSCKIGQNNG